MQSKKSNYDKRKPKRNIIIREDLIIYTALKLFNSNSNFKLPSYLLNKMTFDKKNLLIKHGDKNIAYYTHDNIINYINTAEKEKFTGSFEGSIVTWNLLVIDIKPIEK